MLVGQRALGGLALTGIDEDRCAPGLGTDALDHRQEVVVDEQNAGIAIVQRIDDFRHRPAGVDRVEHTAAPPHAHEVFNVAVGVQRQHAHPLARCHAQALQGASQAGDAVAELAKSTAALAENGDDAVGGLLQRALQALGQVHVRFREIIVVG
ncbi:hypothetical protein D9M73_202200 [compost metagenome]